MQKVLQLLLIVIFLGLFPATTTAQTEPQDGTIVSQYACGRPPFISYDQYVYVQRRLFTGETEAAKAEGVEADFMADFTARIYSEETFEERNTFAGFECLRITYMSDGLKVVGFIWKPKVTQGKKLPLIIYNRGGNQEFGKIIPVYNYFFYPYLANGFVIVAAQYRGVDGGQGKEEFGGAEVDDILNLIPLAQSLDYIDMKNIFMLGDSRGGMMTFLALKNKVPVNAAAVTGAPSDLRRALKERPSFDELYKELIPDYDLHPAELLRARSAVNWADKIDAPLLLMHGGADWRVDPMQTLLLAQKLQALGKPYQLLIYAGDDHGLSLNQADAETRIIAWFQQHLQQ